jgi:hypothetical protein
MAGISGQTLDSMLNRLWGAPAKLERRLSKGSRNGGARSVERPLVTMLAGTHVETFWRNLEDPDLAIGSGFVNRLAPFCVERGRSLPMTRDPDERAAAELREHLTRLASLDPRDVRLNATAERLWVEYSTEHGRRIGQLGYPTSAVVKRVRDHVARLALVFATDAGRVEIESSDLLAAIEVGAFIEASYDHLLGGRVPGRGPERDSGIEAACRVLLRRRPRVVHRLRDLARSWPWHPAPGSRELQRALDSMDDVEPVRVPGARKPAYRLVGAVAPTSDTQPREIKRPERRMSALRRAPDATPPEAV